METGEARQAYRGRLPLVELLSAILKNHMESQRFVLRGMDNVKAEWTMFATALNLQTLWRVWRTGTAFRWNPIRVSTNLSDSLLA